MANWDIGMKHIVDIDGQLLAIDAEVIDTTTLLKQAELPADRALWLVRAGEQFLLQARQSVRLNRDEVLFFESRPTIGSAMPTRLAA